MLHNMWAASTAQHLQYQEYGKIIIAKTKIFVKC